MRKIRLIAFIIFISTSLLAQNSEKIDLLNEGDSITLFKIPLQNGDTILSSDLYGKTIVLVFFATWCAPCSKELPHVQHEIWDKHGKNNKFELFVIGREHTSKELENFKKNYHYTLPFIANTDQTIFSAFATQNIPRMYLINNKGIIIKRTI